MDLLELTASKASRRHGASRTQHIEAKFVHNPLIDTLLQNTMAGRSETCGLGLVRGSVPFEPGECVGESFWNCSSATVGLS